MYIPPYFNVEDADEIARFIESNGFGQLITQVEGKLFATHLPFLFDRDAQKLKAHIALGNPQWKNISEQEVLVIFSGPHGYISPGWYTDPGVPTWNYQAVHISGFATCTTDPDALAGIVTALTAQYEATMETPWVPSYQTQKLRGIVGIEITISDIQCKYKLSQNRSIQERENVAEKLHSAGNRELAEAMQKSL